MSNMKQKIDLSEFKVFIYSRFEVFLAMGMKITLFWDVMMPYGLVDGHQNWRNLLLPSLG